MEEKKKLIKLNSNENSRKLFKNTGRNSSFISSPLFFMELYHYQLFFVTERPKNCFDVKVLTEVTVGIRPGSAPGRPTFFDPQPGSNLLKVFELLSRTYP